MPIDVRSSLASVSDLLAPDAPEAAVCKYIQHMFDTLGDQFERVTLGSITSDLGWSMDPTRSEAVQRALDLLSVGAPPILRRTYELWGEDFGEEVLESPVAVLSEDQIRTAIETGGLEDPVSGKVLADFRNRVFVAYLVTDEAREALISKERS